MRDCKTVRRCAHFVAFAGLIAGIHTASPVLAQGPGGPAGVDIKVRAENRSINDTPFCNLGAGMIGDRLHVDAFMDMNGMVTGTARFEDALGNVTDIEIDRLFSFGSGLVAQHQLTQDTVAIWVSDLLNPLSPALVNVELPRGCGNTKSTFTPGVDKVTMQLTFR